jgi:gliding motility-associated-like protein
MIQNTNISPTGQLLGTNQDVDFVAWGPFTSTASCDQIVFGPCSPPCPNNTTNPNFYPSGNIIDCSYSGSFTETISIPNAQEGEFYIILITNFNGQPGFISLVQTNFSAPNAGTTICCDVNLGSDLVVCGDSVTLNALEAVLDLNNVPVLFEWYFNDVLIPNQSNSTITVSASGIYTVKGNCGINEVEDSILVTLGPAINVVSPTDYNVCDDVPADGFAQFDLNTLTSQVLGALDPTLFAVSYYILEADANADAITAIDLSVFFTNTIVNSQTIYIRVENSAVPTCFAVVPVNLEVNNSGNAEFSYAATSYCNDNTTNPIPIYDGGAAGVFTSLPAGLVIDSATGVVNLQASAVGSYSITNTVEDAGPCGDVVFSVDLVIGKTPEFTFGGTQELCPDEPGTLTAVVTNNTDNAAVSYTYTLPDGSEVVSTENTLEISGPGIYTVEVNILGCTTTQDFEVVLSDTIWDITFGGTQELCPEETGTLTATVTNNTDNLAVSYTYTLPDGSEVISTENTLEISAFGTYTVTVDILGCTSSATFTVDDSDQEWDITFGGTQELCPEETGTLTATVTNNTDNAAVSYTYTLPDGSEVISTENTLEISAFGTYTVTVDILGCTSIATFTVDDSDKEWDITFGGTQELCPEETGTLTATVTNNTDNAAVSYTYTLPDGSEVISTENTLEISTFGTYTVTVDILGCTSSATFTVDDSDQEWEIIFVGTPYVICAGETTELSFTASNFEINNPDVQYTWTSPTGITGTGTTFNANQVGTYTISVNILGCISTYAIEVAANDLSIAIDFVQGCENNLYRLVAEPFNDSFDVVTSTFDWSGPSLTATEQPNAIVLRANGDYTVTVTNDQGCSTSKTITVNNISCTIQKGISPNNDTKNDFFDLRALNVKELFIYNRYGTQVYRFAGYTNQWGGQSHSGDELPDGTYFYVIQTVEGENITGWIFINR